MGLAGKRLLIVERDPELARLVGAAAESRGAQVSLCGSADEALAELRERPADGAVLALPLAGADPAELLQVLRRSAIPAVALFEPPPSAGDEPPRLEPQGRVPRPFLLEDLMQAVVEALEAPPAAAGEVPGLDLRDFDSLVFSEARPALDELVPARPRPAEPEGLARPLPEVGRPRSPPPERGPLRPSGQLAAAPLPRLLAALHAGCATGALLLRRGPARRILLFEDGAPVFAEARGPRGAEEPAPGAPDPVAEIAWSAFEWREGSYRIALGPLRRRERMAPSLSSGDLILEGMRRVATLPLLRRELPAEAVLARAPAPAFDLSRLAILPFEAGLLACADGTKSAADLVALSGAGERAALAFLQASRHMGILEEVDRVLSSTRRIGFL